ncbi:uncharacterized protein LOC141855684 [Brevipalpus obovatus]|uniref:uncharacterized protein LOC141855684 n=1 Tax=Brevipalpus obovatus TaxID=246614 RepID=UPI003D9F51C4
MPPSPSDSKNPRLNSPPLQHGARLSQVDSLHSSPSSKSSSHMATNSNVPNTNGHTGSSSCHKNNGSNQVSGCLSPSMASNGPHSNPVNGINESTSNGSTHVPGKQGMSTVHHHHHRRVTNSPADGVSSTPPGPSMPVIDSNTSMGNSPSGGQSNENSNVNNCPAPPLIVNGSNSNANLRPSLSPSSSSSTQYGSSSNNSRQISKLKRLLSTLHQFVAETSSEMGDRVHSLIIGLVVEISKDCIRKILVKHLNLKKMNARWVPFKLNESQKRPSAIKLRYSIDLRRNWNELIDRIVTIGETWVYHENTDSRYSAAD